jgi:hypothetical protein
MRVTLFDFLMQRTSPESEREFHRILAAGDTWIFDTLNTYYNGDIKKFEDVSEGLFGKRKGPLEMTPEELERISRLTFEAKEGVEVEVQIQPEDLVDDAKSKTSSDMKYIVDNFYLKNERYFANPSDIDFEEDTWTLHYKGRQRLLKKLLKEMGIRDDVIKQTVGAKKAKSLNLTIPVEDIVDTDLPKYEDITLDVLERLKREIKPSMGVRVKFDLDYEEQTVQQKPKDKHITQFERRQLQEKGKAAPKPPTKPQVKEKTLIVNPTFTFSGQKMDIYEGLKKCKSLDQAKIKQIFEGDLRPYMK